MLASTSNKLYRNSSKSLLKSANTATTSSTCTSQQLLEPTNNKIRNFASSTRPSTSSPAPPNSPNCKSPSCRRQLATAALQTPKPKIPPEIIAKSVKKVQSDNPDQDESTLVTIPPISVKELSILYEFTSPPPSSALSALAARLASSTKSTSSDNHSLEDNLPLLEQALIHPSFWIGVQALPPQHPDDTAPRTFTLHHDSEKLHNGSLSAIGNALLGSLASELVLSTFPMLPTNPTQAAVTMYVGPKSLSKVVQQAWGVAPSRLNKSLVGAGNDDETQDGKRMKRSERAYGHLVGGRGPARKKDHSAFDGAAGQGLVRWNRRPSSPLDDEVLYEDAMASVARAVVGAIYQVYGFAATRTFVHAHFLSRLLPSPSTGLPSQSSLTDLTPLLKFTHPTSSLLYALQKYSMDRPQHRLLKESGRLSSRATFISGVYSGDLKLGEGFGSSIKMSQFRASEDALRRLYLGPGEEGKRVRGQGLPSDAWATSAKAL
ncbi:hypothetical protein T439DRAFT_299195 [Meredithblackwellia eburnea MCA 4105]